MGFLAYLEHHLIVKPLGWMQTDIAITDTSFSVLLMFLFLHFLIYALVFYSLQFSLWILFRINEGHLSGDMETFFVIGCFVVVFWISITLQGYYFPDGLTTEEFLYMTR